MQNYMGKCRFCGREVGVMAESQELANDAIERNCQCGGARLAEKKEEVRNEIEAYVGEECENEGFKPVSKEIRSLIMQIGELVAERKIRKASLAVDGTTITITGGEKVEVKRGYKYEKSTKI